MASIYLVVVVLAVLSAAKKQESHAAKTVGELFFETYKTRLDVFVSESELNRVSFRSAEFELGIIYNTMQQLYHELDKVPLQAVYQDLNHHCAKYLETLVEDLTVELRNATCVNFRLSETFTSVMRNPTEVVLERLYHNCTQRRRRRRPSCSVFHYNCSADFQQQFFSLHRRYIEDIIAVTHRINLTPDNMIMNVVYYSYIITDFSILVKEAVIESTRIYTEPFTLANIIRTLVNPNLASLRKMQSRTLYYGDIQSAIVRTRKQLTTSLGRFSSGSVHHPCSIYKYLYSPECEEYEMYSQACYFRDLYQTLVNFLLCANKNEVSIPLSWSTAPLVYFNSQCLCVAFNRTRCGVKPSEGVDPHLYCLSVLLRDFQKQVSRRPADTTYFDFVLMTRVPVCQFTSWLPLAFDRVCDDVEKRLDYSLSLQCYFQGLLNKELNCSETLIIKDYNKTLLCGLKFFVEHVICEGEGGMGFEPYGSLHSWVVHVLKHVEGGLRTLTLTTYLACPQLRNLPGKLLIGYQVTALLRFAAVFVNLEGLTLALRLDVASDLASTLWLTAYLQFLTSSMRILRLPETLTSAEQLAVLLRCSLLGWALPAALSAAFFSMDDALDSRLMVGQLLLVLCKFVALLANLFMFFYNCKMYYCIKRDVLSLKVGATARSLFSDIFNFALKTSVLSWTGVSFWLLRPWFEDLETFMIYYTALGTLQALLFFLLYGCSRESRAFWRLCFTKTLSLCLKRKTDSP